MGEDKYKIAIFLTFLTSLLTVPLNIAVKHIFFKGILPPSIQAVKEATSKYIEEMAEAEKGHGAAMASWEVECKNYREAFLKKEKEEKAQFPKYGMGGVLWKFVPHALKRGRLEMTNNKRSAHQEVLQVFTLLFDRRQEIEETMRPDEAGREAAAKEGYR